MGAWAGGGSGREAGSVAWRRRRLAAAAGGGGLRGRGSVSWPGAEAGSPPAVRARRASWVRAEQPASAEVLGPRRGWRGRSARGRLGGGAGVAGVRPLPASAGAAGAAFGAAGFAAGAGARGLCGLCRSLGAGAAAGLQVSRSCGRGWRGSLRRASRPPALRLSAASAAAAQWRPGAAAAAGAGLAAAPAAGFGRRLAPHARGLDHVRGLLALALRLARLLALADLVAQVLEGLALARVPVEAGLPVGGEPRRSRGATGLRIRADVPGPFTSPVTETRKLSMPAQGQSSPSCRNAVITRAPFTKVPLAEPRSSSTSWSAVRSMRAWTLDTALVSATTLLEGARPSVISPAAIAMGGRPSPSATRDASTIPCAARPRFGARSRNTRSIFRAEADDVEVLEALAHRGLAVQEGAVRALQVLEPVVLAVPVDLARAAATRLHGHRDRRSAGSRPRIASLSFSLKVRVTPARAWQTTWAFMATPAR